LECHVACNADRDVARRLRGVGHVQLFLTHVVARAARPRPEREGGALASDRAWDDRLAEPLGHRPPARPAGGDRADRGVAAHDRGRLGRMVHSAVGFLALEGTVALYALIVLSPVALLAALLWSLREARRRREERLVME